jgi:hypothetical protein
MAAAEAASQNGGHVPPVRVVQISSTDLDAREPLIRAAEKIMNARTALDGCAAMLEDLEAELGATELDLSRRVLSKRRRDHRYRARKRARGTASENGSCDHPSDRVRVIVTDHGLVNQCGRCGQEVRP